ncbi:MAG: AAA family ATPase, partial [Deltaproteobacteria bacterium]|nr:AAA family ATPase [Deltaproteobacteria bacterium]
MPGCGSLDRSRWRQRLKIRSLCLTAFGPFTGRQLVFAGDGISTGVLNVVYGANEAGKSTALRAVSGLLFGIPSQTVDAFRHPMTDLRLGAVLEAKDGTVVEIVRRKGKKNTLLDAAGNVLDDGLLRQLCGAATEATFRALFGLDHVSLREGAEALLAGQGDVGESLFEAALGGGGRGIHRVLADLQSEADALFTPKAHKRKLNDAINAYHDARASIPMKARSGEAWLKQKRGLEEAKAEHERLAELLRARKRELHRFERARRLLPLGARRDRLLQRIAALGDVTLLPPDAAQLRTAALNDRQQATAELARLRVEIAEAVARRDSLSVP